MKQRKPLKPWIRSCFLAGLALLVLAGVLYAVHYIRLDSEFSDYKDHFGDTYDEIFALSDYSDEAEPILALGREAFSFSGSEEEAKALFGSLYIYRCRAARQDFTLEHIVSKFDGDSGYVWVAYTRRGYEEDGSVSYLAGTEEQRCLARWTAEKHNGEWVVTEIDEHP